MRKKIAFLFLISLCAIGFVFAEDGKSSDTGSGVTPPTGGGKAAADTKPADTKPENTGSNSGSFNIAARDTAIKELEGHFRKGTKATDFSGERKTALDTAKSTGKAAVNRATTDAAVKTALANARAAINKVQTDAEVAANLRRAQDAAIRELDRYFRRGTKATDFTGAQKSVLEAEREKGRIAINAASSIDAVNTALKNAKDAVDKVQTDKEVVETLEAAKRAKIRELDEYLKAGTKATDFTDAQKDALEKVKVDGKDAIAAASDTVAVTVALIEAKLAINELIPSAGGSILEKPMVPLAASCLAILAVIALFALMLKREHKAATARKLTDMAKALITENTAREREHKELREEISSLSDKFESTLKTRLESLSDSIEKTKSLVAYNDSQSQKAKSEFREQIEKLKGELWDISSRLKPSPPPPPPPGGHAAEVKAVTDAFNQWAANPSSSLPPQFYCLKNYMSMRSECELIEASEPTKWIANKTAPLCLFPNPNFFTPHTDISEFYDMDITKLKPKGQNKIKITEPCEMTEKGYVTYPGKLDVL
jgi:hypothetical protein